MILTRRRRDAPYHVVPPAPRVLVQLVHVAGYLDVGGPVFRRLDAEHLQQSVAHAVGREAAVRRGQQRYGNDRVRTTHGRGTLRQVTVEGYTRITGGRTCSDPCVTLARDQTRLWPLWSGSLIRR